MGDRRLQAEVEERIGQRLGSPPTVFRDTTNFMAIERDHVIELGGESYLVRCNEHEGRCGMHEQPKFWVKRVIELASGETKILKLVVQEEFKVRLGVLDVRCFRSAEKEGEVLERVRGDTRFMQGRSARDDKGNLVRILDYIRGPDLLAHLFSWEGSRERYFEREFPGLFAQAYRAIEAIEWLHQGGLCHGDIRNDHILIDRTDGRFRWIDFDLAQDFTDFDVWHVGNILHCLAAGRPCTFAETLRERPELRDRLSVDDGSAVFPHRIQNLRLVYPWIPERLNRILMRFSLGTTEPYASVGEIAADLRECASTCGWPVAGEGGDDASA